MISVSLKRFVLYAEDNDKNVYGSICQKLNFLPYFLLKKWHICLYHVLGWKEYFFSLLIIWNSASETICNFITYGLMYVFYKFKFDKVHFPNTEVLPLQSNVLALFFNIRSRKSENQSQQ